MNITKALKYIIDKRPTNQYQVLYFHEDVMEDVEVIINKLKDQEIFRNQICSRFFLNLDDWEQMLLMSHLP